MKTARSCAVLGALISVGWALCLLADRLSIMLDQALNAAIL